MLSAAGRRGFTLVEIMLAMGVTLIVAGATHNVLLQSQRVARSQAERVALQATVRAGSLVVASELSELNAVPNGTVAQNDLLTMGPTAVVYRAMRGIGFVCHTSGSSVITLARNTFTGHRDPQAARDEAYVFVPGNRETGAPNAWVPLTIASVATSSTCPGGHPGITLALSAGASAEPLEAGTPVRLAEPMELRLYEADDEWWLGARAINTGEAIQPLVGPLATGGFRLEYLDAFGTNTLDRTRIRSIRITIRGVTEGTSEGPAPRLEEELISRITLRNSPGT
jgi:prepilin-type N-terminal cleavage/methylation domain-containing protein